MLDLRTLSFAIIALGFILAVMLWLAAHQARNMEGAHYWAGGQFSISLGLTLTTIQPFVTFPTVYVGDGAIFLGMGLTLCGIKPYLMKPPPWILVLVGTVVTTLLAAYFTEVQPNPTARVVIISTGFGAFAAWGAHDLLIRIPQPMRTAYWLTGGSFACYAATSLARAVVLSFEGGNPAYASNFINIVNSGVGAVALICACFGFVLMINYRMAIELERLASIDSLTGTLNRRSLNQRVLELAGRASTPPTVGVAMLDIDHFKSINDRWGHPVGDEVLEHFARVARVALREGDLFARMGGEEFCAVLAHADEDRAAHVAERIRSLCTEQPAQVQGAMIRYTLSAGVTSGQLLNGSFEHLVRFADRALYFAKQSGRDQIVRCSNMPEGASEAPATRGISGWGTQSTPAVGESR
jgi:diguanylate cyclase (GGDEF)-like protein